MRIQIELKSNRGELAGRPLYYPACDITKAFALANPQKETVCRNVLKELARIGVEIEYFGNYKSKFLDSIGAKRVEK